MTRPPARSRSAYPTLTPLPFHPPPLHTLQALEGMLHRMGVRWVVLPAMCGVLGMWTRKFGYTAFRRVHACSGGQRADGGAVGHSAAASLQHPRGV